MTDRLKALSSRGQRPFQKRALSPFLAAAFGVFATAAVAEAALRVLRLAPPEIVTFEKFEALEAQDEPHAVYLWRGRVGEVQEFEVRIRKNALNLHDSDHSWNKPPDVYRILVLGDSFVESLQVSLEKTFFKRLEADLNRAARALFHKDKVEVIAIGHSGAGALQELEQLADRGLRFNPDLVITLFVDATDFRDDLFHLMKMRGRAPLKRLTRFWSEDSEKELEVYRSALILKRSYLNRWVAFWLYQALRRPRVEKANHDVIQRDMALCEKGEIPFFDEVRGPMRNGFRHTLNAHAMMRELAERRGARYLAVFATNPYRTESWRMKNVYAMFPELESHLDLRLAVQKAGAAFDRMGVRHFDLGPGFEGHYWEGGEPLFFKYDGHWNEKGHELAASLLAEYLRNNAKAMN